MKNLLLCCLILFTILLNGCLKPPQQPSLETKVSIQLWAVRAPLAENFDQTIERLAAMGFQGVELAGYFGPYQDDPQAFLQLLRNNNLVISSAHVSTAELDPENIDATIRKYQTLGVDTLILPSDKRSDDANKIKQLIQDLNRIQDRLEQDNIRFGFHNHAREFTRYKEHTFWDAIAHSTNADFILQLDIGWVNYAGFQAVDYIEKYSGRTKLAHFKPKLKEPTKGLRPIIGQDDMNWHDVLKATLEHGGIEWLILEQEEYPDGLLPLDSVALSKQGLDKVIQKQLSHPTSAY